MDNQSFLFLRVEALRYAMAVTQVLEITKLPELMPVAHLPDDIIGILNYRGVALPVMQLSRRLGNSQDFCSIRDRLVVMEWQGIKMGIVVHAVEDVQAIKPSQISLDFSLGREADINAAFLCGTVTTSQDEMVMILNPEALICHSEQITEQLEKQFLDESLISEGLTSESLISEGLISNRQIADGSQQQNVVHSNASAEASVEPVVLDDSPPLERAGPQVPELIGKGFFQRYCPTATPKEQALFRQRAEALRPAQQGLAEKALSPIAIMRLGEGYFGLDLTAVREFIQVTHVTPVPCCPKHIVGNMNLRGEVMTLVDIRAALRVSGEANPELEKAVVVDTDDIIAGITVDQICDIVQLASDDISPVPAAASSSESYFTGMASYQRKPVGILNFSKLVQSERFVVDEAA